MKELRKTWTSKFQDYHILLWSNCRVPAFENWFRKSRTTRTDMLFNETYNKVIHLIPSVKNPNKWFMKLGTLNCVNCSRRIPKRSARYVYHTGTSASSTARAGTSCEKEQRKTRLRSIHNGSPLYSYLLYKEKATSRALLREEARRQRIQHRPFTQEKVQKEVLLGYPRPIHTRRKVPQEHDGQRSNWRNLSTKWMILRTKTTPTI